MSQFLDDEGAIQANDVMGSSAKAMLDELLLGRAGVADRPTDMA